MLANKRNAQPPGACEVADDFFYARFRRPVVKLVSRRPDNREPTVAGRYPKDDVKPPSKSTEDDVVLPVIVKVTNRPRNTWCGRQRCPLCVVVIGHIEGSEGARTCGE